VKTMRLLSLSSRMQPRGRRSGPQVSPPPPIIGPLSESDLNDTAGMHVLFGAPSAKKDFCVCRWCGLNLTDCSGQGRHGQKQASAGDGPCIRAGPPVIFLRGRWTHLWNVVWSQLSHIASAPTN
jgi:hypothetical protein